VPSTPRAAQIARSSQQTELIKHVQAKNAKLRTDRARREQAKRSVWSQDRLQEMSETRRREGNAVRDRQDLEELRMAKIATRAKEIRDDRDQGARIARTALAEQRKAAGLERRMSYVSRSVEKAEREQRLVQTHQDRMLDRRNSLSQSSVSLSHRAGSYSTPAALRSPLSSTISGF